MVTRVVFRLRPRRGGRRARAARPARGPAAGLGAGHPAARAGHPRVPARRALRRAAAGDDRDLRRRRQLAGQPQAAAPVGAVRALRDRHRPGRGRDGASRSWPTASAGSAPPRRSAAAPPAGSGGCAGPGAGARGRPRALAGAWRPGWTPAATAGRPGWAAARRLRTGGLLLLGLCRHLRRHLRRPRPHRAPGPRGADAGRGRGGRVVGLWGAGRRVRAHPLPTRPVARGRAGRAASGILVAVAMWRVAETQLLLAYPGVDVVPGVSALALVGVLVGLVPAVAAPPPTSPPAAAARRPRAGRRRAGDGR